MAQAVNRYKVDLRDMHFALFEHLGVADLLGKEPFQSWGPDEVKMVLEEAYRFSREVTGPLSAVGDREGCRIENGRVKTPEGFKAAWDQLYQAGFKSLSVSEQYGGQGAPTVVQACVAEMLSGSNSAFEMYSGLAFGAAEVIEHFGTAEQRRLYVARMFSGQWCGSMCLTEPHAGSDVGSARSTAKRNADGTYNIVGTKIYISGGDHDLTENIVHLVLARIEGAPAGTKGLSLFIVPAVHANADGVLGERNDVKVVSIEHKMGLNGSATCVLQFGDEGKCVGHLVGTVEHQGMPQMFRMMNFARIGVGLQGLSIAASAYLNALEYAKDRKQGANIKHWKDPSAPRAAIIEHPDVRRMLLDMKSRVEGIRALILKVAQHQDRAQALKGKDDASAAYHTGQVELLTPLVKAYGSDQGFRVAETAIQVFGGAGYVKDHPVEQYCRDAKVFSIYEGTNHIQALDLVARKLGQGGGKHAQEFFADIQKFIDRNREHVELGPSVAHLQKAHEAVAGSAMQMLVWFQSGEIEKVPLIANRFLEMMSELTIGWLLLDQASIALRAKAALPEGHKDHAFYEGKRYAATYFAQNVLPDVPSKAKIIAGGDKSPMAISDDGFGAW